MRVLIVGSGGREHAIAWKLAQSPHLSRLYCAPGNAGTADLADNVAISAEDVPGLLDLALSHRIELTVVGPEVPLVAGIVDRFLANGLAIVGPSQEASRLEGSKAFAKDFMLRHAVPTAAYEVFGEAAAAEAALRNGRFHFPTVIKADGLAAGKGVFICPDLTKAIQAVQVIMRERQFGTSGDRVVVEEFLEGEEASFMVLSDGRHVLPLAASQDHKAIYDGDQGPNTGGMGAYSTEAILSEKTRQQVLDEIIYPTIQGMAVEGRAFRGVLYAGLMLTAEGPRVLEFNVRFGDPETQVVLPRLQSDLLPVLRALAAGDLADLSLCWSGQAAVCVVVASGGYPGVYEKGREVAGLVAARLLPGTTVFHAGTALRENRVVTSGGRVLGVTALGFSLREAIGRAYAGVDEIRFQGMYCRRDIGAKGLRKMQGNSP